MALEQLQLGPRIIVINGWISSLTRETKESKATTAPYPAGTCCALSGTGKRNMVLPLGIPPIERLLHLVMLFYLDLLLIHLELLVQLVLHIITFCSRSTYGSTACCWRICYSFYLEVHLILEKPFHHGHIRTLPTHFHFMRIMPSFQLARSPASDLIHPSQVSAPIPLS